MAAKRSFKIEKGASAMYDIAPNTLAFSRDISQTERVSVAFAFVEVGFPLLQTTAAQKMKDNRLVQVTASPYAQQRCGRLSAEEIRAGKTCGRK